MASDLRSQYRKTIQLNSKRKFETMTPRAIGQTILLGITCITLICFYSTWAVADIYVSTDGSDTNAGSKDAPLATIQAARKAIASQQLAGKQPITVWVSGGTYYLIEPLRFEESDSGTAEAPITYRAMPGERVVLKGSQPVDASGWQLWKDGIYQQSLKETALASREINQLFMSDRRMVRARFPNWDFANPLRSGKGYLHASGDDKPTMEKIRWAEGDLEDQVKNWKNPKAGIVHAFHTNNWGNFQFRIGSIDSENRLINFSEGGWQAQRRKRGVGVKRKGHPGSPFYIENIFEELDAPLEWFHDPKTDTLYFKPPADVDLAEVSVEAAVLSQIIEVKGAKHIHFDGFRLTQTRATFMDAYEDLARGDWAIHRGGAVYFKDSENCSVKNFHIEQVGGNGIFVDGFNDQIHISDCLIEQTGDSSVCFVGNSNSVREYQTWTSDKRGKIADLEPGPKTEDYPRSCSVKNSILRDVGIYGKQTSGAIVSMAKNITVEHCSVYRIARAGVTFNDGTWGGHVMAHCDIYDAILDTGEHGPFNSWGRERFWNGSKMTKEWVLLDSPDPTVLHHNRVGNYRSGVSAGNWTIDLDDGSSNYEIYNNLMLGSTLKLRDGFFRNVYNNIMVSAVPIGLHVWPKDNSDDRFERNITVVAGSIEGKGSRPTSGVLGPIRMPEDLTAWGKFDHNLWWNVNTQKFSAGKSAGNLETWQKSQGANSVLADPQFVDPLNRNYQVKPTSPALALGFKNFPMDQFGHRMTRIINGSRDFAGTIQLTIRPDARGGEIRYTLDGSTPTKDSALYSEPLTVTATTTVHAATFDDSGFEVGFADSATLTQVDKLKHQSWLASLLEGKFVAPKNKSGNKPVAEKPKATSMKWAGMELVNIADFPDYIDASGGQASGVFATSVPAESAAHAAGLKKGDTIIRVGSKDVQNLRGLQRQLRRAKDGEKKIVSITVFRDYQQLEFSLAHSEDSSEDSEKEKIEK